MRSPIDRSATSIAVIAAILCGSVLVAALSTEPATRFAPPALYATIETLVAVAALAAAGLMRGRFLDTRRRSDLLLASAILAFCVLHVVTTAIPAAFHQHPHGFLVATDLYGELLVNTVIAAAALASRAPSLITTRRPNRRLTRLSGAIVAVAAVVGYAIAHVIPSDAADAPVNTGNPVTITFTAVSVGLLTFAAICFAREAASGRDRGRLLIATGLIAMATGAPLLLNRVVGDDLSLAADALQAVGFVFVAAAGLRWELQARRLTARGAAIAERQRVARDLHDGLAQDLALIAAHGEQMATEQGAEHPVATAARRALQISRCAIAELSDPDASTVEEALEATATELRHRFGIAITLDVELQRDLEPVMQADVDRIVREAIANAVRHGGARTVVVLLQEVHGHMRLCVQDDGRGIDAVAGEPRDEGFGLRSIRERAAALGGSAELRQAGAGGTVLEVVMT